jgi:hypothetical protein
MIILGSNLTTLHKNIAGNSYFQLFFNHKQSPDVNGKIRPSSTKKHTIFLIIKKALMTIETFKIHYSYNKNISPTASLIIVFLGYKELIIAS